jgi:hypothetical protein
MIKGINGNPYVDLSSLIDCTSFAKLHPTICRSFALANKHISIGNLDVPEGFMNIETYRNAFTPLYKSYTQLLNLPDDHPIKVTSKGLSETELATYLKFALGAYDLYSYYFLVDFKEGWRSNELLHGITPTASFFPEVIDWVKTLVEIGVFTHVGRASFFMQEAGGVSFEHKDPSVDPEHPEILSEFIHIRPNLVRPFYVRDNETLEKHYINTCVGYWNDQDWLGGDSILEPSYAFRVDGVFTDEFRKYIYD